MSEEILNVGALDNVEPVAEEILPTPEPIVEDAIVYEEILPQQAPTE